MGFVLWPCATSLDWLGSKGHVNDVKIDRPTIKVGNDLVRKYRPRNLTSDLSLTTAICLFNKVGA